MTGAYPPAPRLPRLLQTVLHTKRHAQFLGAQARRFGDVFTVRLLPPYPERIVVFSRPDHIKEIFTAGPADLHAGEAYRELSMIMGEHSVLLTDDSEHARARRLLMPAFAGAALNGYRALVEDITKTQVERWTAGSTEHILSRMEDLTLDVITQVVFGVADEQRRAELTPQLRRITDMSPVVLLGWKWPLLRRFGPWRRMRDALTAVDELLYAEIARRRAHPEIDQHADVLSRLLAVGSGDDPGTAPLSDAELRDQLVTLLLAGHETTASALSWALHELAAAPEVQDRARQAARDGDDKYLEAVVKEALRHRMVIGRVQRQLTKDMTIGGVPLPRGTRVSTSIVLAHQNPANHPAPERFRPERFLEGTVAPNTWLPFGGGVRRCIGAGFSLMEGAVVLRAVLTRYQLALPGAPERGRVRNITNVPARGARLVVTALDN
ncbi:cytochrome P450 [Nocardia ninae]|uniref:Putative cytochrome P450 135A1 n=1 Tax=Nocardia ninae NBRC 108245 TaxID=1210091 RepID=A0A511M6F6_9NOCA|nr:cytochrome P450 [Nocardia ninae]GEM36214.1 putative cytochrome P450 135A1 [Nocardia ninae NBRC 108245]